MHELDVVSGVRTSRYRLSAVDVFVGTTSRTILSATTVRKFCSLKFLDVRLRSPCYGRSLRSNDVVVGDRRSSLVVEIRRRPCHAVGDDTVGDGAEGSVAEQRDEDEEVAECREDYERRQRDRQGHHVRQLVVDRDDRGAGHVTRRRVRPVQRHRTPVTVAAVVQRRHLVHPTHRSIQGQFTPDPAPRGTVPYRAAPGPV